METYKVFSRQTNLNTTIPQMIPISIRHLKQALSVVKKLSPDADNILLKSNMAPQAYDRFLVDLQIYGAWEALTLAWRDLETKEVEQLAHIFAGNSTTVKRRTQRNITPKIDLHGLV